jgi:hypothetical protein
MWRWARPRCRSRRSRRGWSRCRSSCCSYTWRRGRCWCRCRTDRRCWTRRRRWRRAFSEWNLHLNSDWRSCLKEAYRRVADQRRLIGVEPEIIQCAPTNRVGVLAVRKRFAVPRHSPAGLTNGPWSATIPLVIEGAVVCPARMLRRRVKSDITDVSGNPRHAKGLNATIKVHVKDGVLIVPNVRGRVCHLVTNEENPIVTQIGLDLVYCCACSYPSLDGRLHSHRATDS